MTITLIIVLAVVIGYIFGRIQGERHGINAVVNNVRGTGCYFTQREVIIGDVVSWEMYEKNQLSNNGTVGGVSAESRSANSKHEASVLVSGVTGYKHPFLNKDIDG